MAVHHEKRKISGKKVPLSEWEKKRSRNTLIRMKSAKAECIWLPLYENRLKETTSTENKSKTRI